MGAGSCDSTTGSIADGGGSGGAGLASFKGFSASDTVSITVGSGGSGGAAGGNNGSNGSSSKATYSGTDIIVSSGGGASSAALHGSISSAGSAGTFSASAGGTGLTLAASLDYQSQDGLATRAMVTGDLGTIPGGGNPLGHAGTYSNHDGALGGGGLGCFSQSSVAGGNGGNGVVIVTWVN
ncbi:MAG: hypothetical protein JO261_12370 [Alphaproteobacteria bacterium]|nr:hypothetical protein [Alphaproteobacteria bacterium]MBV9694484.1 hypothetical protein [Alphaproteobacteria bacterium]